MHYIQSQILDKLLYADSLHYAKLRPARIESNHFAYHLKQLMHDGLVTKVKTGVYTLAPAGLAYVDRLSHGRMTPREQPNIVTMMAIHNERGEELLFQREYQPFIGRWGYPSGKTHLKEPIGQSAKRELYEKTGLSGVTLEQRGVFYLETRQQGYVISKVLVHIFTGTVSKCDELTSTSRGTSAWKASQKLSAEQTMPGFHGIRPLIHSNQSFFFAELDVEATP